MTLPHEEWAGRIAAELRRDVAFDPLFDARVMAAVRAEPRPGTAAAWWAALTRPRPVMISPLGGLALAAGIAGLVLGAAIAASALRLESGAGPAAGAGAGAAGPVPVQFVLVMPEARSVALVGDFNDWDVRAAPLERAAGGEAGVWTVTVPLEPGRYRYTFVVDGSRWIADPAAPQVEDDFGQPNSVITVGGPGT
jgi:hypothetical protein